MAPPTTSPAASCPTLQLPSTLGGADRPRRGSGRGVSSPTSIRAPAFRRALPEGWDDIPGARGCTPQSCAYRDAWPSSSLGARWSESAPRAPEEQGEFAEREHIPFPLLERPGASLLAAALGLPTFEAEGMTLYRRLDRSSPRRRRDRQGLLPGLPPDRDAAEVLGWLRRETGPGRRALMEAAENRTRRPRSRREGVYRFSRRLILVSRGPRRRALREIKPS